MPLSRWGHRQCLVPTVSDNTRFFWRNLTRLHSPIEITLVLADVVALRVGPTATPTLRPRHRARWVDRRRTKLAGLCDCDGRWAVATAAAGVGRRRVVGSRSTDWRVISEFRNAWGLASLTAASVGISGNHLDCKGNYSAISNLFNVAVDGWDVTFWYKM